MVRRSARLCSSFLLSMASGALVAACSALVSPDPSRLYPGGDGGSGCGRCDDGDPCTTDGCAGGGACTHTPVTCAAGMTCLGGGCVPTSCTTDAQCDDHLVCNGTERCAMGTCTSGAPLGCDDGLACTIDSCAETGGCVHTPDSTACGDSVFCTQDLCDPGMGGHDAAGCVHVPNDTLCAGSFCSVGGRCDAAMGCVGGTLNPCTDATACTTDSCDPAAMMCVHAPVDADGDGYPAASVGTSVCTGTDCADANPAVHPGATEVCSNRIDDNCNGMVDEGCVTSPPDTCATAQPITLDASGHGTVSGTLGTFNDDYAFCMSSGGRDAVYFFDLTSLSDVVISTQASGTLDTVLAVGLDCAAPPRVCNDDQDPGNIITSRMFLHRAGPPLGTTSLRVYVYVDGFDAAATGPFTLDIRVTPAAMDSCGAPLDISGGGTVSAVGPLTGLQTGSCQALTAAADPEGVFRLAVPADGSHNRIDVYSTTFVPEIYMRRSPCGTGTELACRVGAAIGGGVNRASLFGITGTAGTTQFLFADGMPPAGGPSLYVVDYDP